MFLFTFDIATVVQLILTVLMPIMVGFVTTKTTPGATKSWLLAGLTLVTSLLVGFSSALVNDVPFDVGVALLTAIPAFAISVATYYGLWKPTGISTAAQDVEKTTLLH